MTFTAHRAGIPSISKRLSIRGGKPSAQNAKPSQPGTDQAAACKTGLRAEGSKC